MPKFSMKDLLNDTSKTENTAETTAEYFNFDIQHIPLDKIIPSPLNQYGLRDIEELAASIEEIGLLHNIAVYEPNEAGLHELSSGNRRYEAYSLLYRSGNEAFSTIPCKVERRETPEIDELKLIHANATARVLTDYEKTMQAGRIKEIMQQMKANGHKFKGRMRDIVAEMLDVSPAQMGRMESINKNLRPELKEAFEREEIGITDAYKASLLNPTAQAAALETFNKTGELNTSRPPEAEPPPEKPKEAEKRAETMERAQEFTEEDEESEPKRAYAFLSDTDGGQYEASGSLAVIAAIDGEDFGGYISEGEAAQIDFIMLATALVGEFVQRMGDDTESKNTLKANLAALFNEAGGQH